MKKMFVVILAVITAVAMLCGITVCAAPRYAYTTSVTSTLSISSNTAYCKSILRGDSTVTKIEAVQYLEKKNGTKWQIVSGCTWSDSANSRYLTVSNSKSGLSSGTYRVRAVFTVYSGTSYETVEKISSEVTN